MEPATITTILGSRVTAAMTGDRMRFRSMNLLAAFLISSHVGIARRKPLTSRIIEAVKARVPRKTRERKTKKKEDAA
jgi:hypothetical protein